MAPPSAQQVARVWTQAVAETSYVAIGRRALTTRLAKRVNQILAMLDADVEDIVAAREIGMALVSSHFTDPASLTGTLWALGDQLTPYATSIGRDDRLRRLLGALAGGYAEALRDRTLAEQERIHTASLVARAEAERARRDSEARFQAVFAEAGIGIGIGGLDGQIMEVNRALCDMLGYTFDELQGLTAVDFMHPSDDPAVWSRLAGLVTGEFDYFRKEVETAAQATLLASLDCDLAQGWHFGVPSSAEDVTDLLQSRGPVH